ncbi:MAG: hypothetical protein JST28_11500 [Acidobacteria bacterium]|nr:hypothetical protein [Acidobacteriota bacterium]
MKSGPLATAALIPALAITALAQNFRILNDRNIITQGSDFLTQSRGGYLLGTGVPQGFSPGVFRFTTSGTFTYLHPFAPGDSNHYFFNPSGGLTLGTDGRFYGVTEYGTDYNVGKVFQMTPDGTVKTLHTFTGGDNGGCPFNPPILSMSGDFYGTTEGGCSGGSSLGESYAVIYRLSRNGNFTVLHVFSFADRDKAAGRLIQGFDEWIYGTTGLGGAHGKGSIFRINRDGHFETVYSFDGAHGIFPNGWLVQANDGSFYGTTQDDGLSAFGAVYRLSPSRQFTLIHNFSGESDGAFPRNLVLGSDGNLYGTSIRLNVKGGGVLFRLTPSGQFSVLHNFNSGEDSPGDVPVALIQHTNGLLYGDTANETRGMDAGGPTYSTFYSYNLGLAPFVSYLPSYGRVGTQVDILGENFSGDSKAFFNGVRAQVVAVAPTYMKVVVPSGAATGWITVTTNKGTLKSDRKFVIRQ